MGVVKNEPLVDLVNKFNDSLKDELIIVANGNLKFLSNIKEVTDFFLDFLQKNNSVTSLLIPLLNILYKFGAEYGIVIGENNRDKISLRIRYTFDSFIFYTNSELGNIKDIINEGDVASENMLVDSNYITSFKEAFEIKLKILFSTIIETDIYSKIFSEIMPTIFFKNKGKNKYDECLRKRIIYFVFQDNFGIEISKDKLKEYGRVYELLSLTALLYNDDLLKSAVDKFYFKSKGTAQLYLPDFDKTMQGNTGNFNDNSEKTNRELAMETPLPDTDDTDLGDDMQGNTTSSSSSSSNASSTEINDFYETYYRGLKEKNSAITSDLFPIPVEEMSLPYLLFSQTGIGDKGQTYNDNEFEINFKEPLFSSLIENFWDNYCSSALKTEIIISSGLKAKVKGEDNDTIKKMVKKPLTDNLFCYLFGKCGEVLLNAGIITENIPGEIISLGLVQYTKLTGNSIPYLSYSVAEYESIAIQFTELIKKEGGANNEKETKKNWIEWAQTLDRQGKSIKLDGRPTTSCEDFMTNFMSYASSAKPPAGYVKANGNFYSYMKKRKVSDYNDSIPISLMDVYEFIVYEIALQNISNINVTKASLLSEKIGTYLSNPQELASDLKSALSLNVNFDKGADTGTGIDNADLLQSYIDTIKGTDLPSKDLFPKIFEILGNILKNPELKAKLDTDDNLQQLINATYFYIFMQRKTSKDKYTEPETNIFLPKLYKIWYSDTADKKIRGNGEHIIEQFVKKFNNLTSKGGKKTRRMHKYKKMHKSRRYKY